MAPGGGLGRGGGSYERGNSVGVEARGGFWLGGLGFMVYG